VLRVRVILAGQNHKEGCQQQYRRHNRLHGNIEVGLASSSGLGRDSFGAITALVNYSLACGISGAGAAAAGYGEAAAHFSSNPRTTSVLESTISIV
jgi:hypothetical protein